VRAHGRRRRYRFIRAMGELRPGSRSRRRPSMGARRRLSEGTRSSPGLGAARDQRQGRAPVGPRCPRSAVPGCPAVRRRRTSRNLGPLEPHRASLADRWPVDGGALADSGVMISKLSSIEGDSRRGAWRNRGPSLGRNSRPARHQKRLASRHAHGAINSIDFRSGACHSSCRFWHKRSQVTIVRDRDIRRAGPVRAAFLFALQSRRVTPPRWREHRGLKTP